MPQNTVNTPIITANVWKFPFFNKKNRKKSTKDIQCNDIFPTIRLKTLKNKDYRIKK